MHRQLPPLNTLTAFEAAARHLSFTKAAQELHVTQAAISHQIKHLEERLGFKLFRRMNRSLLLTEEGQIYLPTVRDTLERLATATEHLLAKNKKGAISVSVLPSFATRWLVPRLWKLRDLYPDLDVRVSAFEWPVDFNKDEMDLAVRYGRGNWPGLRADLMLVEEVFPVCSPSLARGEPGLERPEQLSEHTLLHDDYSKEGWPHWLTAAGVQDVDADHGLSFSHTSIMLEAAERGQGVALGRSPLVADDLARGRLVAPFDVALPGDFAFYVVCPEATANQPKIAAVREWLLEEAAQTPQRLTDLRSATATVDTGAAAQQGP